MGFGDLFFLRSKVDALARRAGQMRCLLQRLLAQRGGLDPDQSKVQGLVCFVQAWLCVLCISCCQLYIARYAALVAVVLPECAIEPLCQQQLSQNLHIAFYLWVEDGASETHSHNRVYTGELLFEDFVTTTFSCPPPCWIPVGGELSNSIFPGFWV